MVIVNLRKDDEKIDSEELISRFRWLERISQGTSRKGRRIQVLAAVNHDGVLSAKIMCFLLTQLHIDYSLRAVKDNEDISKYIAQVAQSCDPPPCIISLNCGANFRWVATFEEKGVNGDVMCLVIDSHRPVNLSNASRTCERVIILDDDPRNFSSQQTMPSDSESDSESLDDLESEAPASQLSRKRLRNAHGSRAVKKSRIKEYYEGRGTFFANPAAVTLYKACDLLQYRSADMLWCACVSLSAHFDLGMMTNVSCRAVAEELEKCVTDLSLEIGVTSNQPDEATTEEWHYPIVYSRGVNAPLCRHWTLWDSLFHSPYVYGRLQLQRERGIRNLKEFLALCGILPAQYSDHYRQMTWEIRRDLIQRFTDNRLAFNMNDIIVEHFNRQFPDVPKNAPAQTPSSVNHLGGSECALILYALLDNDAECVLPEMVQGQESLTVEEIEAWLHKGIVSNFHRALDASLFRNYTLISEGLHNAIQIQELVVGQAQQIMEQKLNKRHGYFRCFTVQYVLDPIFCRPMMVRRLGLWFIDTMRAEDRLPQLVVVHDALRKTYIFVGVARTEDITDPSGEFRARNPFSKIFRDLVRLTACRCSPPSRSFDEATLEVLEADYQTFMSALERIHGEGS